MSTGKRIYRPRELSRRQFLGLGAAGAGLLLAGCGGGGQNYGEGGGGGGAGEFHGAYPYQLPPVGHYNTFVTNAFFQLTLYQDVLEMPMAMYRWAERKYVSYMATEWGFEPPDVFKVTLREGAKWSDGSEFTSKDVVTTFNILRLQEQLAWNYLASVEPEDDYNLTFKMKDPSTVVERLVLRERIRANSVYGEWSEKAQELFDSGADSESKEYRDVVTKFEEFRPEQMVVSGPFNIDKKTITESQLTMDKVETAWNADRTNFDRMIIYNGEVPGGHPDSALQRRGLRHARVPARHREVFRGAGDPNPPASDLLGTGALLQLREDQSSSGSEGEAGHRARHRYGRECHRLAGRLGHKIQVHDRRLGRPDQETGSPTRTSPTWILTSTTRIKPRR